MKFICIITEKIIEYTNIYVFIFITERRKVYI